MSPADYRSDQSFAWGTLVIILLIVIVVLLVGYFAWWAPANRNNDTTIIESPDRDTQVVPVPVPQETPSQPAPQETQPSGTDGS